MAQTVYLAYNCWDYDGYADDFWNCSEETLLGIYSTEEAAIQVLRNDIGEFRKQNNKADVEEKQERSGVEYLIATGYGTTDDRFCPAPGRMAWYVVEKTLDELPKYQKQG